TVVLVTLPNFSAKGKIGVPVFIQPNKFDGIEVIRAACDIAQIFIIFVVTKLLKSRRLIGRSIGSQKAVIGPSRRPNAQHHQPAIELCDRAKFAFHIRETWTSFATGSTGQVSAGISATPG